MEQSISKNRRLDEDDTTDDVAKKEVDDPSFLNLIGYCFKMSADWIFGET
jgi:hypothetical protein